MSNTQVIISSSPQSSSPTTVQTTTATQSATQSSTPQNALSATILSDVGMASLVGAFTVPVVGAFMGTIPPLLFSLETALGTTGTGLAVLYPSAFSSVEQKAKTLPSWEIALIILGGGALIVGGTYWFDKHRKNAKKGVKK